MASTQYYFSLEDLKALLDQYGSNGPAHETDGKVCLGVVFTPGSGSDSQKIFSFPLYGDEANMATDGDIVVQNTTLSVGCPYPPRCK